MSAWPLYRENLAQGPSHVSLSLPGKTSDISKSVGGTQPALLMIPNTDYLNSFIGGSIGISDSAIKGMLSGLINSPSISNNEELVKRMSKTLNLDIPDISKYKDPSGKINIPVSEIKVPNNFKNVGIEGLEKTVLKSIFETQKPFIEITKIVLGSMVKAEDIVARVMPLLAVNPLTSKSEKPIGKDGSKNGTRAIGYQGGADFKKAIAELEKISKTGSELTIDKDGNPTRKKKPKSKATSTQSAPTESQDSEFGQKWQTISTVYSTGEFDPTVDYEYTYVILPSDDEAPNDLGPTPADEVTDQDDPYKNYKPKRMIFGLFKHDGTPLDPREKLKTVALDGISVYKADTPFATADWVYKSPKWKFQGNEYIWPSMSDGKGQPIYVWEGPFGITRRSKTSPGDRYSIRKYKDGDKNLINKDLDAIPGDPVIAGFETQTADEFNNYFRDVLKAKSKSYKGFEDVDRDSVINEVMGQLDTQSHLQNVYLYGSGPNSYYRQRVPEGIKRSLKPHQIYVPEAVSDPNLDGSGMVWIDPESDYEFKVIRVDPSAKIRYREGKGASEISSNIKAFVKNRITFVLKEGQTNKVVHTVTSGETVEFLAKKYQVAPAEIYKANSIDANTELTANQKIIIFTKVSTFDIEVRKNGSIVDTKVNVTEYTLENWNYDNGKVNQLNFYNFRITYQGAEVFDETYTGISLPGFGISRKITVDQSSLLDSSQEEDTQIPLYSVKVNTDGLENGVLIQPDAIVNDFLATDKLFSNGFYGNGTKERPQDLEVINRYARTDLDTESYYIIEGVLADDTNRQDTDAGAQSGGGYYRLPHAIGAIIPFANMLFDLGMKMFPTITKTLKLLKDPTKFVTDIITEKLGESFDIFSEPSLETFKNTKDILKRKNEILQSANTSDYVEEIQKNFNASALQKHVNVDRLSLENPGKFNFIHDGTAMIQLEIFGKSIPFGMELKMSNLIPEVPNINTPKVPTIDAPKIPDPTAAGFNGATNVTVEKPKITVPNVGIPSITKPQVSSPFRLIIGKIGKSKTKDCDSVFEKDNVSDTNAGLSNSDYSKLLDQGDQEKNATKKTPSQNNSEITTTWYSTGTFIQGVDYNYFYITDDQRETLKQVDELMYPGSSSVLNVPGSADNGTNPNVSNAPVEDLQLAKELLESELKKDPTNKLLKLKLDELKSKLLKNAATTQPILKMVLGMVTPPIKVIACILQWLFEFFKSILNPMMLPSKIIELLSFKWIMKFFTPPGLLKTFGINYNPAVPEIWKALIAVPTPKIPDTVPSVPVVDVNAKFTPPKPPEITTPTVTEIGIDSLQIDSGVNLSVPGFETLLGPDGFPVSKFDALGGASLSFGNQEWLIPDETPIGDMSQVVDLAFTARPPVYTAQNLRLSYNIENLFASVPNLKIPGIPGLPDPKRPEIPKLIARPPLCLVEKIINGFIDFIWSLLGIEVVIPPPHIILCDEKKPEDVSKLKNGETKKDNVDKGATEVVSTNPYKEKPTGNFYVYEITFDDGTKQSFKDYEAVQEFMIKNSDVNFDVGF